MNVTYKQRQILLNYIEEHLELLRGRLSRKSESRKTMKEMWEDLANILNGSAEGPKKSAKKWRKSWNDWRMNVLKKETKRQNHLQSTGDGSPMKVNFSDIEEKLLELLTPEAAGIVNVPQGGIPATKKLRTEQSTTKDLHRSLQLTSMREDRYIDETEQHEEIQNDELQLSEEDDPFLKNPINEGLYISGFAKKKKQSSFVETTTKFNSDNKDDKENITGKNRNQLFVKKQNIMSPRPSSTLASNSLSNMSAKMLQMQEKKKDFKQQELEIKRDMLVVQQQILQELKNINANLQVVSENLFSSLEDYSTKN